MRRSLVGFQSPNFGHAFLDAFEELDQDKEEGYFEDSPVFGNRINRGTYNPHSNRIRLPADGRGPHNNSSNNNAPSMGLRELSSVKWQTRNSPDNDPSILSNLLEPEPSLDDVLLSPPPDWALCCVCHEIFKQPMITLCGHSFCYECIIEVIHRKGNCPLCRQPINQHEITENKKISQKLSELVVRCRYSLQLVSPPLPISSSFSSSALHSHYPLSSTAPLSSLSNLSISNTTTTTTTTTTSSSSSSFIEENNLHQRLGSSSPIAIRSPSQSHRNHNNNNSNNNNNNNSHHPISHARSLPSNLPSFMRTAAKWVVNTQSCEAICTIKEKKAHENDCPHRPVKCYHDGCSESVKSKDLEEHMETCSRRVIQCNDCKEMFLMVDEITHNQNCPDKEFDCVYCTLKVKRKEQTDHVAVCTHAEVECEHAQYGCTHKGPRKELESHQMACPYKALGHVINNLKLQVTNLQTEVTRTQSELSRTKGDLVRTQNDLVQARTELTRLRALSDQPLFRDSLFE